MAHSTSRIAPITTTSATAYFTAAAVGINTNIPMYIIPSSTGPLTRSRYSAAKYAGTKG